MYLIIHIDGIDLFASFALQNIYSKDLFFRGTGWLWGAFLKRGCVPFVCTMLEKRPGGALITKVVTDSEAEDSLRHLRKINTHKVCS